MAASAVSEYMKIRRYVMNLIHLADGETVQIPTVLELCKKFGVSRPTVCKALKALAEDGYITGKRGLGSFINPESFRLKTPVAKRVPIIGVIFGDGMSVHCSGYELRLQGAILTHLSMFPCVLHHLTSITTSDPDLFCKEIKNEQLDALFWYSPGKKRDAALERLKDEKIPLLFGGDHVEGIPSVQFNYNDAGYQCGKILVKEGRRNVVFYPNVPPWDWEADGLRRAYNEAGIQLNESFFFEDYSKVHEKLREIISYGIPVDAICGQMQYQNEMEDYILQLDPEIYKRCAIMSNGLTMPSKNPFHRLEYEIPFDTYGKKVSELIQQVLAGTAKPEHHYVKVPIKILR